MIFKFFQQTVIAKKRLKEQSSISSWSVVDVCEWLSEKGLGQYSENFTKNEIEGEHLKTILSLLEKLRQEIISKRWLKLPDRHFQNDSSPADQSDNLEIQ